MAVPTKVFGKPTSLMVKVIIKVQPCNIREDGNKINFMVMEFPCGKMEGFIRVIMLMAKRKEKELTLTPMARNILVIGMLGCNMDMGKFTMLISKLRRVNGPMVRRIIHELLIFIHFIYFLIISYLFIFIHMNN